MLPLHRLAPTLLHSSSCPGPPLRSRFPQHVCRPAPNLHPGPRFSHREFPPLKISSWSGPAQQSPLLIGSYISPGQNTLLPLCYQSTAHSFRVTLITHTILRLLCLLSIKRQVVVGTCTKSTTSRAGALTSGEPSLPPSRGAGLGKVLAALGKVLEGFSESRFLFCKMSVSMGKVVEVSD